MDNGHGLMAHFTWVPPYSTQLLISKVGIVIVLLTINLSTLVKFSHVTINQEDWVLVAYFHHCGTMIHSTIIHRTSNIYFASSFQYMHVCHFCQKPQLTSPGSKQCYQGQIFLWFWSLEFFQLSGIYICFLHYFMSHFSLE